MFGKVGELKKMYDKYKSLQKVLKKLVIRRKEGSYIDPNGETIEWAIVVEINGEMKLQTLEINDMKLLDPTKKSALEEIIVECFKKAQTKAQEVVAEKTKDVLWFDPSNIGSMMWGGWMPGLS